MSAVKSAPAYVVYKMGRLLDQSVSTLDPPGFDTYFATNAFSRIANAEGKELIRAFNAEVIVSIDVPSIRLLDEATSALDSESEHLIQEALTVLMEGKTVIVIAHRLSTIMSMDRIVVLEHGAIAAQGTHAELIKEGGLYHKLWSIQAGSFVEDENV